MNLAPVQGFGRESAGYIVRFGKPRRAQRTQRKAAILRALRVLSGWFLFRELRAAAMALPGRDGRAWRGAFARRGVMKVGRLCGEGRR